MIKVKSIVAEPSDDDGFRVFVEPVWPGQAPNEKRIPDIWFRDLAPGPELYSRYLSGILKWEDFLVRYHRELERCTGYFRDLQDYNRSGVLTVLHASPDQEHNIAVALKMFMEKNDPGAGRDEFR